MFNMFLSNTGHEGARPPEEGASSCWLLPFINIHYLTPPADGNMVIRNYLDRRRISYSLCTRDTQARGCKMMYALFSIVKL